MKNFSILFALALLLSACMPSAPSHSIRIYDENAYAIVKPMLSVSFLEQKIDTEILPSSSTINPLRGIMGNRAAKKLYKRLSLSFRFSDPSEMEQSILLEDYISSNAKVNMHAYGFTIDQGSEYITATILGETDWNNDIINDYIVSFRINQKTLNYESNNTQARVELPAREYILLIKNVDSSVYKAEILFIRDYIKQSTGIRSEIYKNHESARNSLFQEHVAISYEQGQEQIVRPPDTGKKSKSEKKKENVRKIELSQ